MWELFKSGEEVFLYANLVVLMFSFALTAQRVHSLWIKHGSSTQEMLKQVLVFVEQGSYARALQLCNAKEGPVSRVFKAALVRANRPEREIRRGVEIAAVEELPKVKAGTAFMPQLSNLATLLGLIGTIRGLIISFQGVSGSDPAEKQALLAEGISIAFYNTYFGLIVAVLIIFIYLFILARQNKLLAQLEHGTAMLVDHILVNQASGNKSAA